MSFFASSLEKPIEQLTEEQKNAILSGLLKMIYKLNKAGVITIQRMCFTCSHYQVDNGVHYCHLLKTNLAVSDIRVNCPEHEMKAEK